MIGIREPNISKITLLNKLYVLNVEWTDACKLAVNWFFFLNFSYLPIGEIAILVIWIQTEVILFFLLVFMFDFKNDFYQSFFIYIFVILLLRWSLLFTVYILVNRFAFFFNQNFKRLGAVWWNRLTNFEDLLGILKLRFYP